MKNRKSLLLLSLFLPLALLWAPAHAEDLPPLEGVEEIDRAPAALNSISDNDDEYSFSWLDPDKKIYVLQNRRYLKARRVQLSALGGLGFSNPYRRTLALDGRAAFYITEQFGFEGFYAMNFHKDNDTFLALKERVGSLPVMPVVREVKYQYGGLVHWVPWYAKINVFNKILYFDWYLSGGLGMVHNEIDINRTAGSAADLIKEDKFAFFLGTGHQYFLNQMFAIRLDFTSAIYRSPLLGNTGALTWFSNLAFNAGLGVRF